MSGPTESERFCDDVARREAKNFYASFRLLPTTRRRSMCALYAFMRHTDDLVDAPGPAEGRRAALAGWRAEVEAALDGRPTAAGAWPGMAAWAETVRRHAIPTRHIGEVLDGVAMDLEPRPFATFGDLYAYCYRVASAVGLCCLHIWGYRSDGGRAEAMAEACGVALQLTNIIRDVGEDAAAGRVYLPAEDMERFGVSAADLAAPRASGRLKALLAFEARRAEDYYAKAAPLARLVAPVGRPVLAAIAGVYESLLDEIRRRDFEVLASRARVPSWRKAWVIARSVLPARARAAAGRAAEDEAAPPAATRARHPAGRRPRTVIVGGGLAGLAAAVALAESGEAGDVLLIESRPRLGGRASSFVDPITGEPVDNCQHVSMACCTNLADFCRRVGTAELFRRERAVTFVGPAGDVSTLRAGRLPAPLHLSGSFLRAKYLTFAEKLRVAFGLGCLRFAGRARPGESFGSWLRRHGQDGRTIERYWSTVLVSALNERVDRMDVGHARKVFLDGFLRNARAFEVEIPLVPLGDLYGTRLESWLAKNGVQVRLTTGVRSVDVDGSGDASGVTLRGGEFVAADAVILAVPFDRVRSLVPDAVGDRVPGLAGADRLESSPITGIHLWFDRPVFPHGHAAIVGRLAQWVFDHTALQGRGGGPGGGQYLQVVISAAYDLLPLGKEAVRDAVLDDLAVLWPAAREAALLRWWVVTEHGATFAVRPGVDALRPPQRTPVPGLFLAGDWTATGWPATMEGAVRSGYLAAEVVLADRGVEAHLVRPGLPAGRLARLLLGREAGDSMKAAEVVEAEVPARAGRAEARVDAGPASRV